MLQYKGADGRKVEYKKAKEGILEGKPIRFVIAIVQHEVLLHIGFSVVETFE
ncbi:MAG: hypothetical protein VB133_10965 [Anaeromusa sp.]|uniref:hypothetical protein n=1 Tax=Anaeromusa sp. TaxID=1872520 RepID=UPI002B1ED416|nr:hypothetical protein [Anaeromusa sp.]MEA4835643.1 hypothetical protein [Anaeromusa sp.]